MELTWQSIITAGGVLSALLLLLTTYNRVYRWTLRQKEQDEELKAIRKENTLLTTACWPASKAWPSRAATARCGRPSTRSKKA